MQTTNQYGQHADKAIAAFRRDMRLGRQWLIKACSILVTLWLMVGCVDSSKVISIDPPPSTGTPPGATGTGTPGGSSADISFSTIIPQEYSVELNWANPRPNQDTEGIYKFTISWVTVTPTRDQLQQLLASTGLNATLQNEVDQAYQLANHSAVLDFDQDTILYPQDNCLHIANPSQADSDEDGIGDACDPMNSSLRFVPGNKQVNISWLNPEPPSRYENSALSIVDNNLIFSLANDQLIVNWTNPDRFNNGDAVNITQFTILDGTTSVSYTPQTGENASAAEVSTMLTLSSPAPGDQHTITVNATNLINGTTTIHTIATGCVQIATSSLVAPCGSPEVTLSGVTLSSFTLSISNVSMTDNILVDTTQPGFSSAYGGLSYYFYDDAALSNSEYNVTLNATYSNGITVQLTERDSPTNHTYQDSIHLGTNYDRDALADVVDNDRDNDGIQNSADTYPRRSARQDSIVLEYEGNSNSIAFYQADSNNSYQVDGLTNKSYYNFMTIVHFRSYINSTIAQNLGYQSFQNPIVDAIEEAETNRVLVVNQYIVRTGINTDNDSLVNVLDPDDDGDGVEDSADAFPVDPDETVDSDGDGLGDNADIGEFNGTSCRIEPDCDNDGITDNADIGEFNGTPCRIKPDCDNDGTEDLVDAFPRDPNEFLDTDMDGTGDNADPDDDNDGNPDGSDSHPKDPFDGRGQDGDGVGRVGPSAVLFFNSTIPQEESVGLSWTNPQPDRDTEGIYKFTVSWVAVTPTRDQLQALIASTGLNGTILQNEVDRAYRQANHSAVLDLDGDDILYPLDNCLHITNPSQADADQDGMGDACDPVSSSLHFIPGNKQVNISWLNPVQPSEYENNASSIVDNGLTFSLVNDQLIVNWTNPDQLGSLGSDQINITLFTILDGTTSVSYTPQTGENVSAAEVSTMLRLNSPAPGDQHTITVNATNFINGVMTNHSIATGCVQIATSSLVAPCGSQAILLAGVTLQSFILTVSNNTMAESILVDGAQPGFSSAYGGQSYYFYNNTALINSEYDVTLNATYSNGMTVQLTEQDSPTNHPYQTSVRLGPNYDRDALADAVDSDMDNDGINNNADTYPLRSARQDSIVLEYQGNSSFIAFYQADNIDSYQVDGLTNRTYYNFMTEIHFRSYTDSTTAQSLGYQALQTPIAGAIEEAETNRVLVVNQYIVRTGVNTDNDNLVNILDPDDDDDTLLDSVDTGSFKEIPCQLRVDCDRDGTDDIHDAFPTDAFETADSDGDGVGDNGDACPNTPRSQLSARTVDQDRDGCRDRDEDIDDNNNRLVEVRDETSLRAMVLDGAGLMLSTGGINSSGCPKAGCNGYELINDITLTMDWDPIGNDTDPAMDGCQGPGFNGRLHGGGHSIRSIDIDLPQTDCVGLFSHLGENARITSVNLEAGRIRGKDLVGSLAGSGRAINIMNFSASFDQLDGQDHIGGFIGNGANINIESSSINLNNLNGHNNIGGGVGGGTNINIVSSHINLGNLSGYNHIGGLVGHGMNINLTSSYAIADTIAGNTSIGGLLGKGTDSDIHASYVVMINMSGDGQDIGGLVGTAQQLNLNSSYAVINNISGDTNIGGLIGNSEDSVIANSYALFSRITGTQNKGGLIGTGAAQNTDIHASYWDIDISGGISSDSQAKTTLSLRDDGTNMIYTNWTVSCLVGGTNAWDFAMNEYPVLNCTPDTPAQQRSRWSVVNNLLEVLIR